MFLFVTHVLSGRCTTNTSGSTLYFNAYWNSSIDSLSHHPHDLFKATNPKENNLNSLEKQKTINGVLSLSHVAAAFISPILYPRVRFDIFWLINGY